MTIELEREGRDLEPGILRDDGLPSSAIYGTYGISLFAVRDLTLDDLDEGLTRLSRSEHHVMVNPYHEE